MKAIDVPPEPLLVDTNIFSFLYFRKYGTRWRDFAALIQGHLLCMSFASMGEALANGHRARWGQQKRNNLLMHLRAYTILPFDSIVVEKYAELHAKLSGHLKGQGINDMWTAACALSQPTPLPIVTDDLSDFQTISSHFPPSLVHPDL